MLFFTWEGAAMARRPNQRQRRSSRRRHDYAEKTKLPPGIENEPRVPMVGNEADYEITRSGHVYSRQLKRFIQWKLTPNGQHPYISVQVGGVSSQPRWPNEAAEESWAAAELKRVEQERAQLEEQIEIQIRQLEEQIETQIRAQVEVPETERDAIVKARLGQGVFRENVAKVEKACRITGVSIPIFLIASHIKPWRHSSNQEKLDGNNGLLLTPSIDFLFDRGFISFGDNGDLLLSPVASLDALHKMGVDPTKTSNVGPFNSAQQKYLRFHRAEIFRRSQD
ncbi:HNH endonuclease [Archangium lansingense]|uniref:HNH endonuclease n=1 Tax=Archangium lansingense TaxID=2995310 RepID=UPI003B792FC3